MTYLVNRSLSLAEREVVEYTPFPTSLTTRDFIRVPETWPAAEDIKVRKRKEFAPRSNYPVDQYSAQPNLSAEYFSGKHIIDAFEALYQSDNTPRNRRIADRLIALYRDALAEGESILVDSIKQFADFFLRYRDLGLPKITLTPDGTLRVRWIRGSGDFTAIEFTGKPEVKMVAEVRRENGPPDRHFLSRSTDDILSTARDLGASFG
jgi:hypothetical protein